MPARPAGKSSRQPASRPSWRGLAQDAAAITLRADRPGTAIGLLEQGRSRLWSQRLDLRTDLRLLLAAAHEPARRMAEIRAVLDRPGRSSADRD